MDERTRISNLIERIKNAELPLTGENKAEVVKLLEDAAWARLIAAPILLLYSDEKAYFYDASATSIYWSKCAPMICNDAGKRATAALSKMPWARYKPIDREHWLKDVCAAEDLLRGEKNVRPISGRGRGKAPRSAV